MKTKHIILAQELLNTYTGSNLQAKGVWGTASNKAAFDFVGDVCVKGTMYNERWIALTLQRAANLSGVIPHEVKEDGWYGPVTIDAAYRMMGADHVGWRPDELNINYTDVVNRPRCWTPSDKQMISKFGYPGSNLTIINLPYKMRLAWDLTTPVTKATCHKLFADPLEASLKEIHDAYGYEKIVALRLDRTGGIYNKRRKRGGSTWSAHAFAVAIDIDPDNNQLRWKKPRAKFSGDEYKPMRDAFARNGIMSLGECYDFDWMHFQLNP